MLGLRLGGAATGAARTAGQRDHRGPLRRRSERDRHGPGNRLVVLGPGTLGIAFRDHRTGRYPTGRHPDGRAVVSPST